MSADAVTAMDVSAYTVPTETPEADGTLSWNETTVVIVRLSAAGQKGSGFSFANLATAHLIDNHLRAAILRCSLDIPALWVRMLRAVRNLGSPGVCSMAISAVDNALWDLKARLLDIAVADLLGRAHQDIAAYASGGFTSYSEVELQRQLAGWIEQEMHSVKMKIGSDPPSDLARVRAARTAIGPDAALFVDANGAYGRKEALARADAFADLRHMVRRTCTCGRAGAKLPCGISR